MSDNKSGRAEPIYRAIQIHPSLRRNLTCRHRYPSSEPRQRQTLSPELVRRLLADAAAEGYTAVSFSGEPLLWPGLPAALATAKRHGLVTALTTNLIALTQRRLDAIAGVLDAVAVSLDGTPASRDRIRGKAGAYAAMATRLEALRGSGIAFGFLFTLSDDNLDELPKVADFAIEQRAQLLQVHPLEETSGAALLAFMRLRQRIGDRLAVRLDFAHRDLLRAEPWRGRSEASPGVLASGLADLVSPLVVEASGFVAPLQYGFPRRHALGSLYAARLPILSAHWRQSGGYDRFRAHCAAVLRRVTAEPDVLPTFNAYEAMSGHAPGAAAL